MNESQLQPASRIPFGRTACLHPRPQPAGSIALIEQMISPPAYKVTQFRTRTWRSRYFPETPTEPIRKLAVNTTGPVLVLGYCFGEVQTRQHSASPLLWSRTLCTWRISMRCGGIYHRKITHRPDRSSRSNKAQMGNAKTSNAAPHCTARSHR